MHQDREEPIKHHLSGISNMAEGNRNKLEIGVIRSAKREQGRIVKTRKHQIEI